MSDRFLPHDWYASAIPANVELASGVYLDSAYAFASFLSRREPGLRMGHASGAYDRATFVVGPDGFVDVGPYTCLNATYLVCHDRITIGAHCLLAWGSVITDCNSPLELSAGARRRALAAAARHPARWMPAAQAPRPVVLEDNVWVGFNAVVLPGVTLGRGSIVGCNTVVAADVPPYAVCVGSPARIVRTLDADDDNEARRRALEACSRG